MSEQVTDKFKVEVMKELQYETEPVYLWPDGTWCFQDELETLLAYMSDDYEVITDPELVEQLM